MTPRLLLEPLVEAHAAVLYPLLQDVRLYTFIPQGPPASSEALAARYRALSARRSPDGSEIWLNWALRLRADERYVGIVQATIQADRRALLAYMVFHPFQGQGFAREGCIRVLKHLCGDYGMQRVAAEIDTRNSASIALVESLGFTCVAMDPAADFFKGSVSDEYRYEYSPPA